MLPAKKIPKSASMVKSKKQNAWNPSFDDFGDLGASQCTPSSQGSSNQSLVGTQSRKRSRHENDEPITKEVIHDSLRVQSQIPVRRKGRTAEASSGELWVEKHTPQQLEDLAVHKKKVGEVQTWLEKNSNPSITRQSGAPILLMTGPAGTGKTATMYALASHMKLDVKEWTNPLVETHHKMNNDYYTHSEFVPIGGTSYESQSCQFTDFLLRANRYPSLQMCNLHAVQTKVILVEEFPNIFFRETHQFHNILRRYRQRGESPLVFIVSDSAGGESNERLLFPKDLQAELFITNISFNPVAPTSLNKVLQRIASAESTKTLDKSTLDQLVQSCAGDIRGAINALQFSCSSSADKKQSSLFANEKRSKSSKSKTSLIRGKSLTTKRSDSTAKPSAAVGARDTSLFLFRALGKILYCKRDADVDDSAEKQLPAHLTHHQRVPLAFHPEDVLEKSQLSPEFFVSYLHQNYLEFFSELDDVIRASDYLSESDYLTVNWSTRESMRTYAASVATRGLLHSNSCKGGGKSDTLKSNNKWKPLHKPEWYGVNKQMRENILSTHELFRDYHATPEELQTQLLPYIGKCRVQLTRPGQGKLLQDITRFSTSKCLRTEKLDEKDAADREESLDIERMHHLQPLDNGGVDYNLADVTVNGGKNAENILSEDELMIEEFDD